MRRVVAILTLLLSTTLAIRGIWMLCYPEVRPFIVADATDIHVVSLGWGQQRLSYRAHGPPYAWFFSVAHNLETSGFRLSWRPDQSPRYDPNVPLLFQREYGTLLRDEVVLTADRSDPQRATITLRRHFIIPSWRSLLPTSAGRNQNNAEQSCASWCEVSTQSSVAEYEQRAEAWGRLYGGERGRPPI